MKLTELRKVIREEVREAIQEELKDILLEAVKAPRTATPTQNVMAEGFNHGGQTPPPPQPIDIEARRAAQKGILDKMMFGDGNVSLNTTDVNTFNPRGAMAGGDLPPGNVGLDQIMGLMNTK